jgi:dual specificity phosphatase 12
VVLDAPQQNIIQYFDETFDFIHHILEGEGRVLVHCVAGVSRSATIITAYLMRLKGLRYKAALAMLKRVRPFVTPNDGFLEQLRLYQTMGNRVDVNHPDYKKFLEMHSNQDEAGKCARRVVVLNHTSSHLLMLLPTDLGRLL